MECEDCRLVGIVTHPQIIFPTGVLIVVGGPQYRAGSHRQFTLLARRLAASGVASCRFDYRGMGDSEGEVRGYEHVEPDLRTAVDTFIQRVPEVASVVLWGLCDAASAALLYGPKDQRVRGLLLLNPWVENPTLEASARLKQYYPSRLRDSSFWGKVLRLEINIVSMLREISQNISLMMGSTTADNKEIVRTERMRKALSGFSGSTFVILSEKDLMARAFGLLVNNDPDWQETCRTRAVSFCNIAQADHTFSRRVWRDQVADITSEFVLHAATLAANGLSAELTRFEGAMLPAVESAWTQLEAQADASFFQSWTWMQAWLKSLPNSNNLYLLQLRKDGHPLGLGIIGRSSITRHRVLRSMSVQLSETGDVALDTLTVEHNDILMRRGWELPVWRSTLELLARTQDGWEELRVSGMSNTRSVMAITEHTSKHGLQLARTLTNYYYWVDLGAIRQEQVDYLGKLSSNTRQQIRKAMKLYGQLGPLEIREADTLKIAHVYFQELKQLHQSHWQAKGYPGAFATPFANAFHQELIDTGFDKGQVQLLRVTSGTQLIGLLYNFVYNGVVSNYQAGFVYDDNPKLKPGLVCHTLAIEMNIRAGYKAYDFLMGENQYKKSLSLNEDIMYWLVVRRPKLKFQLEDLARVAKQILARDDPVRFTNNN